MPAKGLVETMPRPPSLRKGFFRSVWPYPGVPELIRQYRAAHGEAPQWILLPLDKFIELLEQEMEWERGQKVEDVVKYEDVYICWKQLPEGLSYVGKVGP